MQLSPAQNPMHVALTGASGFVGQYVLEQLLAAGHHVRALVRNPRRLPIHHERLQLIPGNLFVSASLHNLLEECDAVIHLVGIIEENPRRGQTFHRVHVQGTEALLAAARAMGVARWVQMSATGTRENAPSTYHQTKWLAEQSLRNSALQWTLLRPSLIHGPSGDFMQMVRGFCTGWFPPFLPYFGQGLLGRKNTGTVQPVWVQDVATCFVRALQLPCTVNQTYELVGPDVFTMPELYRVVNQHLPHPSRKPIVAVPAWYAKLIAGMPGVPFNRDMVLMSLEQSAFDAAQAEQDFGLALQRFEETFAGYASQWTQPT